MWSERVPRLGVIRGRHLRNGCKAAPTKLEASLTKSLALTARTPVRMSTQRRPREELTILLSELLIRQFLFRHRTHLPLSINNIVDKRFISLLHPVHIRRLIIRLPGSVYQRDGRLCWPTVPHMLGWSFHSSNSSSCLAKKREFAFMLPRPWHSKSL